MYFAVKHICVYKIIKWIISIVLTCTSEEHSPTRDWPSRVCSTTHILSSIQAIYWCRKEKGAITQNVAIRHITDCLSIHCPRYYGWRDTQNLTLHYCWEMFRHNHVCWVDTKMRLIQRSCQRKNTDLCIEYCTKKESKLLIKKKQWDLNLISSLITLPRKKKVFNLPNSCGRKLNIYT